VEVVEARSLGRGDGGEPLASTPAPPVDPDGERARHEDDR